MSEKAQGNRCSKRDDDGRGDNDAAGDDHNDGDDNDEPIILMTIIVAGSGK